MNVASITKSSSEFTVVFSHAMPDANYSAQATIARDDNQLLRVINQQTDRCTFVIKDDGNTAGAGPFSFQIAATNALPVRRGTGADSWGEIATDGTIRAGFNVDSTTRNSTGEYSVVFTTPMPTASYSVTTSSNQVTTYVDSKTANGFTVVSTDSSISRADGVIYFVVHATNATLPDTFTEEQIQGVIDAGPQGVAKAWVVFRGTSSTEILRSYNIDAVTDRSTGTYTITFSTPMSSTDYVCIGSGSNENGIQPIGFDDDNGTMTTTSVDVTSQAATGGSPSACQYFTLVFFDS